MFENLIANGLLYSYQGQMGNCLGVISNLSLSLFKQVLQHLFMLDILLFQKSPILVLFCWVFPPLRAKECIVNFALVWQTLLYFTGELAINPSSPSFMKLLLHNNSFPGRAFVRQIWKSRAHQVREEKHLILLKFSRRLSRSSP